MKASSSNQQKMTVTQAAAYLGVSLRKMSQMVRDGEVKHVTTDPLDRRRKLILMAELDALKRRSLDKA